MISALALAACMAAPPSRRCSCLKEWPLDRPARLTPYVTRGQAAFTGRTIRERIVSDSARMPDGSFRSFPFREIVVAREDWWGRPLPDTILVTTPALDGMCAASLAIGKRYLFLSSPDSLGRTGVSSCNNPRDYGESLWLFPMLDQASQRRTSRIP